MAELLVDTDVLIDHLRGARDIRELGEPDLAYSVITRCELFAGDPEQRGAVELLLQPMRHLEVTAEIAEAAGRIRRSSGIGTPDALIAATGIYHDMILVSRNASDFERVQGLRHRTPATFDRSGPPDQRP